MKAIILDTETTNLPEKGGEACEIAYFPVQFENLLWDNANLLTLQALLEYCNGFADIFHQTFMPLGDFSPQASAVNGFTKEKLKGSPCISTFEFPSDVEYMIGHNVLFDWKILKRPKVKLICTKELSIKYLTKKSGAGTKGVNTLTGLIEQYYPNEAKELIANAHSALQDCKLAYLILLKILEAAPELDSFEKLAEQCTQPSQENECGLRYGWIDKDKLTVELFLQKGSYTSKSITVPILLEDIVFRTKQERCKGTTNDWSVGDREQYDFTRTYEVIVGLTKEAMARLSQLPEVKLLRPPYEVPKRLPYGVKQDSYSKEYVCTFGQKHNGKPYKDILKEDRGYLVWIVEKSTMNAELKAWVKEFLTENM